MTWMCKEMSWKLKFGNFIITWLYSTLLEKLCFCLETTHLKGLLDFGIGSLHPGLPVQLHQIVEEPVRVIVVQRIERNQLVEVRLRWTARASGSATLRLASSRGRRPLCPGSRHLGPDPGTLTTRTASHSRPQLCPAPFPQGSCNGHVLLVAFLLFLLAASALTKASVRSASRCIVSSSSTAMTSNFLERMTSHPMIPAEPEGNQTKHTKQKRDTPERERGGFNTPLAG